MKCLEKDRARRYESATGLAADIRRHLDSEPVVACPPSTGYKVRKFIRRNRRLVGVAVTVLITLLAAAGISAWQWKKAHEANLGLAIAMAESDLIAHAVHGAPATEIRTGPKTRVTYHFPGADPLRIAENSVVRPKLAAAPSVLLEKGSIESVRRDTTNGSNGSFKIQTSGAVARITDGNPNPTNGLGHMGDVTNQRMIQLARAMHGMTAAQARTSDNVFLVHSNSGKIGVMLPHTGPVNAAHFSPDSRLVATCSSDGKLRVWNTSTGRLVAAMDHDGIPVIAVRFTVDGRHVVSLTAKNNLHVWETRRWQQVREPRQVTLNPPRIQIDG